MENSMSAKIVQDHRHTFQLVIDGKLTPGQRTMEVINPATGKVLTSCARADISQLDAAVASAKSLPVYVKSAVISSTCLQIPTAQKVFHQLMPTPNLQITGGGILLRIRRLHQ